MMDRNYLLECAVRFTNDSAKNYITEENALSPDYVGMKIFDPPIFAFGTAGDVIYEEYKSKDVIGEHFITPTEWLPNAETVISFFFPYTE